VPTPRGQPGASRSGAGRTARLQLELRTGAADEPQALAAEGSSRCSWRAARRSPARSSRRIVDKLLVSTAPVLAGATGRRSSRG
jgi:hypothetical protein